MLERIHCPSRTALNENYLIAPGKHTEWGSAFVWKALAQPSNIRKSYFKGINNSVSFQSAHFPSLIWVESAKEGNLWLETFFGLSSHANHHHSMSDESFQTTVLQSSLEKGNVDPPLESPPGPLCGESKVWLDVIEFQPSLSSHPTVLGCGITDAHPGGPLLCKISPPAQGGSLTQRDASYGGQ